MIELEHEMIYRLEVAVPLKRVITQEVISVGSSGRCPGRPCWGRE